MYSWDYNIPKNWTPKTPFEWEWFLIRQINYNDLTGISKKNLKKYFPRIKDKIDPGKKKLLEYYLTHS